MVQDPATAKYDGMPQSAINAGYATHILPVEQMPSMLREVVRQARLPAPVTHSSAEAKLLCRVRSIVKRFRRDIDIARPNDRPVVHKGHRKQRRSF